MEMNKEILESFMPKGFPLDRFDLVKIEKKENDWINSDVYPELITYYFKEKNIAPEWYILEQLKSKWHAKGKTISDLPLRNNFFSIKLKCRRWIEKATNKEIRSNIDIIEEWTRNTKELSCLLTTEKDKAWMTDAQLSRITGIKKKNIWSIYK